MLKAYLHPKKKPNDRHWYAYDVVFDDEIIVTDSRDPQHDLARALLARGIKSPITGKRWGSTQNIKRSAIDAYWDEHRRLITVDNGSAGVA